MLENVINSFNNWTMFSLLNIGSSIWAVMVFVFAKYLYVISRTKSKNIASTRKILIFIVLLMGMLLPIFLLFVSFTICSGLQFWISQIVGWLVFINYIVFSLMLLFFNNIPSEQDLFKKQR